PARVVQDPVTDEGARGSDGAEGEIEHAGRLVEHHDADTGESVGAAECEPEHDVRLEELPVDAEHRERNDVMHRASATPLPSGPMAAAHSRASRSAAPHPLPGAAPRGCRALVQLVLLLPDAG